MCWYPSFEFYLIHVFMMTLIVVGCAHQHTRSSDADRSMFHVAQQNIVKEKNTHDSFPLFSAEKFFHFDGSAFVRKYFLSRFEKKRRRSFSRSFFLYLEAILIFFFDGAHDDSSLHSHRVGPLFLARFLVYRYVWGKWHYRQFFSSREPFLWRHPFFVCVFPVVNK